MPGTASQVYVDGTPTNGSNPWIDSLVWGGAWSDTPGLSTTGGPVTISYSAVSGADPYNVLNGAAMSWSSAGLTALGNALAAWEAVASLDFVQSANGAADVWIWQGTSAAADGALGWSEIPAYSQGEPLYVVFNGQDPSWSSTGLAVGGYGYITLIHELGHLLGLAHPHDGGSAGDGNIFPGVSAAFGDYGDYNINQGIFTTMSYNDGWGSQYPSHSDVGYGWQASPMALDIAAIQAVYGANTTYASGSSTYTLASYNAAGTYWSCIWDTGGTDLITNAGSARSCTINLTAAPLSGVNAGGYVSYASGIVGGYTIANGVLIENATGGSGNDLITGNSAANVLDGGAGADALTGGAGNDTMDGGADTDVAVFSGTQSAYRFAFDGSLLIVTGPDGTDRLSNIETLSFNSGNDISINSLIGTGTIEEVMSVQTGGVTTKIIPSIYSGPVSWIKYEMLGNTASDVIVGTSKNDFINLMGGDDAANGGAGDDVLDGGTGSNFLTGGAGRDDFFLDGRGGTTTWATITDWSAGERLSVWGWRPGVSKVQWVDSAGAPGWTGVTMHGDLDGNGVIDTSVTWTGQNRSQLPTPLEYDGLLWFT